MTNNSAAYLQIQWVEMVFNASGPADGPQGIRQDASQCTKVCNAETAHQTSYPSTFSIASPTAVLHPVYIYGVVLILAAKSAIDLLV